MSAFGWAFFAAVAWGICPLVEKAGLNLVKPVPGLFFRCIGVLIGMVMLALFFVKPEEIKTADMRGALFLVLGGFLASIIGQFFFYNALRMGEVSRLAPIAAAYPFVTFLLGILFLGESLSLPKVVGVTAIVAGVWFLRMG